MGVMRLEHARVQQWASRSASAVWNVFDTQLVLYAGLLAVIGLVMAYTNSPAGATLAAGSTFTRGLMWAAIAIVVFALTCAFDYRWLKTFAWPIYFFNLGLLGITLALGTGVGGVARWVTIGGLQFQFSEIAKILMIIVLANFISGRRDKLGHLSTLIGAGLLVLPPLGLVMIQPDLGTSLVFGAILVGTLFLVGGSLRWLGVFTAAGLAAMPIIWSEVLRDYQRARLVSFLDPTADPLGSGYQLIQSQIAVGSGGIFGKGLTNGSQNQLDFLPVQTTDFVFAILSEELGFVGGLLVFGLFTALIWRVLVIAWHSDDLFGLAFGSGVAAMLLFQLLVNVGMVIGIMPITGIPLPFVTHGGASLISIAVGLGVLESINLRQAKPQW
jgi:rod shape determining protein RodA